MSLAPTIFPLTFKKVAATAIVSIRRSFDGAKGQRFCNDFFLNSTSLTVVFDNGCS